MIRGRRSFPISSLIILFIGLAITVVAWHISGVGIEEKQKLRFQTESSDIIKLIELRTKIYETSLRSFRSAYTAHLDNFNSPSFERYAQNLKIEQTLPSLNGFAFYRKVKNDDKLTFQEKIKENNKNQEYYKKYYNKFHIHPEGERPIYFALEHVYPFQRNAVALGKDIYEDEMKRSAIDYAITHDFAISGTIKIQNSKAQKQASGVILMLMPVFSLDNLSKPSIDDTIGVIACGFQTNLLMKGIISPELDNKLQIKITDVGLVGENIEIHSQNIQDHLIFISDNFNRTKKLSKLYKSHIYEFGGRQWKIEFFATDQYVHYSLMLVPSLVFMGGLIFTMLFFGITITKSTLSERNDLLEESEERFKHIVDFAPLSFIMTTTKELRILICNQRASELFQMRQDVAVGSLLARYFYDSDQRHSILKQVEEHKFIRDIEVKLRRNNGKEFWALLSVTQTQYQQETTLLFSINDISQRKELEEKLRILATTDGLTGIANRRHFLEQADHELKRALRFKTPMCVVMMDIDFFKKVNDTYGHDVGDKVIKTMAQTCVHALREVDIVGRLGGEEFAGILPETNQDGAKLVAERLRRVIENLNIELEDSRIIKFTVSIGLAKVLEQDENIEEVLQRADQALYQAKQSGRNQVCCID